MEKRDRQKGRSSQKTSIHDLSRSFAAGNDEEDPRPVLALASVMNISPSPSSTMGSERAFRMAEEQGNILMT
ncbi:hypothetical protein RRG08_065413 [Elysia crispata]|uniref:Uncharacterized protein n=1 Tax=Elysia crispata TaxID=231223 RepID=A0AAE0ZL54_9GAST|nr:hypothetical protein RRG08_065413 [Elysia crispata]